MEAVDIALALYRGQLLRNFIGAEAEFVTIAKNISSFHTPALEKFVTEIAQFGAQSRSG